MIVERALTVEERRKSQIKLCQYWCFSALGMACCGDVTLPLLAMELAVPDAVIAMLGAMNYCCFLALPLGFRLGGIWGAGRSMSYECMLMALAACSLCGAGFAGAAWMFFAGLTFYLISRAANYSMRFSLQQGIAAADEMPGMLARNYIGLHSCSLLGFLSVSLILALLPGKYTLFYVFLGGLFFFACAGRSIGRVVEPDEVRKNAAQPILEQVKAAWRSRIVRHQIYVGCLLNLLLAAVVPVNILAARRGCGISASLVVLLIAVQAVSAIGGSVLVKIFTQKYGPRMMMIAGYPLLWAMCLCWCLMPEKTAFGWLIVPFVLGGVLLMAFGTSLENYFLLTVPKNLQIGGTFLVFVVTGGIAGAVGMLMNWGLFKLGGIYLTDGASGMSIYRFYYLAVGIVFALGILLPYSLPGKKSQQ